MNEVQIAQGTAAAMQNMAVGNRLPFGDVLAWSYWDTLTLATGTLNHTMFQSQMGVGATNPPSKTNMRAAGVIPSGQNHTVEVIKLQIYAATAMTTAMLVGVNAMLDNGTLTVKTPGKDSTFECTLIEAFGAPFNFVGTPTVAGDNQVTTLSISRGIIKLRKPIVLAATQAFSVNIGFDTATVAAIDGLKIKVELAGILQRMA